VVQRCAAAAGVLVAALLACATPVVPEREEAAHLRTWLERTLAARPRTGPDALNVYLAFAGDVDLDLYVTDPTQETTYFANTPSRLGGRLDADLQCDAPSRAEPERAERIRYAAPASGRYRVSVDHPRSCARPRAAGYAIAVEHAGQRTFHTGTVRPREFRLIALEVDVAARAD
jgi:hypothetical protein